MPYFQRKPWQEAERVAAEQSSVARTEQPDFAGAAEAILEREKRRKIGGPGLFRCRRATFPGEQGEIVLEVSADSSGGPLDLELSGSDLVSPDGNRIAAEHIAFSPRRLTVEPGGRKVVKVFLRVPPQTGAGVYTGRVTGQGADRFECAVAFEVAQPQ